MSAKNLDKHNRWRNKAVFFRVSPEEDAQIETAVKLTGLTKQDYIIRRLLCRDVVAQGNPRVYKALRDQLVAVLDELRRIEAGQGVNEELLDTIQMITTIMKGMQEDIPDHKIYFAEFDDETTALYLCGLLTCSLVQKFIASFHIMIQVGDIFKHMRLPEFDERNHQHMHLVELVREAHNENDADVRNNLLTQISDIGNSIIETWTPTE